MTILGWCKGEVKYNYKLRQWGRVCTGLCKFGELLLIFGKSGSFIVEAVDLPLEFAYRPVATNALNFVEGALIIVLHIHKQFKHAIRQAVEQVFRMSD